MAIAVVLGFLAIYFHGEWVLWPIAIKIIVMSVSDFDPKVPTTYDSKYIPIYCTAV